MKQEPSLAEPVSMTLFKHICDCFQWVMSVKLSSSQSKSMMSIQLRVSIVHSNKGHKAKARLCKDSQMTCVKVHGLVQCHQARAMSNRVTGIRPMQKQPSSANSDVRALSKTSRHLPDVRE